MNYSFQRDTRIGGVRKRGKKHKRGLGITTYSTNTLGIVILLYMFGGTCIEIDTIVILACGLKRKSKIVDENQERQREPNICSPFSDRRIGTG